MTPFPTVETSPFRIGGIDFEVALSAGPRIVGARAGSSPDFMAKLGGEGIAHPAIGFFPFIGGHRLWRSPEVPQITYLPDTQPVEIQHLDNGVRIVGQPDGEGLIKRISIREEAGAAVLRHTFVNDGPAPVRTAPWAITQAAPGGTAYLPLPVSNLDAEGLLPNRNIVVWPYTDLAAPEIEIGTAAISVRGSASPTKAKIGTSNRMGWIAYFLEGYLLVKWSKIHDDRCVYPDMGASIQCYRDERFVEIETVAPIGEVVPGQTVTHKEIWKILEVGDRSVEQVLAGLPQIPDGSRI